MKEVVVLHDLTFVPFISEAQIAARIRSLGAALQKAYAGKAPIFLAVLNGAFIFAADLVRACDMELGITFIKLSSYAGTHSTGEVVTRIGLDAQLKDRHVVLIEDIVDSGETLHYFLPQLAKFQPASVAIAALLVKPDALQHDVQVDYVGFEIPTKFVVGYGLDYNGLGRNLRGIYQLVA